MMSVKNNTQVLIYCRNNKKFLGRVRAIDKHCNMVLENVREMWTEVPKETAATQKEPPTKKSKKHSSRSSKHVSQKRLPAPPLEVDFLKQAHLDYPKAPIEVCARVFSSYVEVHQREVEDVKQQCRDWVLDERKKWVAEEKEKLEHQLNEKEDQLEDSRVALEEARNKLKYAKTSTSLLETLTHFEVAGAEEGSCRKTQRNLDQLEALSKKLRSKTVRSEAPSQSIAATRLLAREGINAEQLARDLKSFELKTTFEDVFPVEATSVEVYLQQASLGGGVGNLQRIHAFLRIRLRDYGVLDFDAGDVRRQPPVDTTWQQSGIILEEWYQKRLQLLHQRNVKEC